MSEEQQHEQEAPAPSTGGGRTAGVLPQDRVLAVGMTRSGKSELLNHLASVIRWQRVLVDTKHEWAVADVEPVQDVAAIDWAQPLIHYRSRGTQPAEFERLFSALNQRHRVVAVVHELGDLCAHQPSRTPSAVLTYLTQGQAHGRGFFGGSQRPVMIPSHARTEATHIFMFVPRLTERDLRPLAAETGRTFEELAAELDDVQRGLGAHSFLWFDRRTRELLPCEPLADHVRARSAAVIRRTSIA